VISAGASPVGMVAGRTGAERRDALA
jgi:hypothetical protein